MSRYTLFVFLLAFFFGVTAVFPTSVPAQGPMLVQDDSEGLTDAQAFFILQNAMRPMQKFQKQMLFIHFINGSLSTGNDPLRSLSQIEARGAIDGPMLAMDDEAEGPLLAQLELKEKGPMLAQAARSEGPAIHGQEEGTEVQAGPRDITPDQEALYREVRELRDMVDRLRQEADARDRLRITEDEERDEEKEILEAAGREYSLISPWLFRMDLRVHYSYNDYDVIRALQGQQGTRIDNVSDHQLTNSFSLESGIRDNLSIDASVPFVYKYDKVSTAQSRDVTNLGDISLGLKYQPLKTGQGYPSPIFSAEYTFSTGKSPFEINPATELSTGSGFRSIRGGVSVSQPFDPVNAFASLSYLHRFRETGIGQARSRGVLDEVDPGGQVSASIGFGYAVSYRMSLSLSLSTAYLFSTDYYWRAREGRDKTQSGDSVSASLGLNTSWRITPRRTIIIGIGQGLTTANPGFSMSLRMPVSFDMR